MGKFIGRKGELAVLEREYAKPSSLVIISGRRHIGKTALIREFLRNKETLYFLAAEETEEQNRRSFSAALAAFTGRGSCEASSDTNWETLLQSFAAHRSGRKKILVMDEIDHLTRANPGFPALLETIWHEVLVKKHVMIILSSSHDCGIAGTPIQVKPLRFTELMEAYPHWDFSKVVAVYSITGGVPMYFKFFQNERTLKENLRCSVLNTSGFLYEEPMTLLYRAVREPFRYLSILRVISAGHHHLADIASAVGRSTSNLGPYLNTLIEVGLVARHLPITVEAPEKSRKGLYFMADNFLLFWFRYVDPYRRELEMDHDQHVFDRLEQSIVHDYLSLCYRDICKDLFLWLCQSEEVDFKPDRVGSYWNRHNPTPIDVVAIDHENRRILAAECRYLREDPFPMSAYHELLKKCRTPDFRGYSMTYGLFSRTTFDPLFELLSRTNRNIVMVNQAQVVRFEPQYVKWGWYKI